MTEGTGTPFNMPVAPTGIGGYSQVMHETNQNGGNSGHLPMNPYYLEQRCW